MYFILKDNCFSPSWTIFAPVLAPTVLVHPVLGQVQLLVEHHVALLTQEDRQVQLMDGHVLLLKRCEVQPCTHLATRQGIAHSYQLSETRYKVYIYCTCQLYYDEASPRLLNKGPSFNRTTIFPSNVMD